MTNNGCNVLISSMHFMATFESMRSSCNFESPVKVPQFVNVTQVLHLLSFMFKGLPCDLPNFVVFCLVDLV